MMLKLCIFLIISILFSGCEILHSLCGNAIKKEFISPNGQLKAVIFERDCGATTGFSTQISILSATNSLGDSQVGNVLISDSGYDEFSEIEKTTNQKNAANFEAEWINDTELFIRYTESRATKKYSSVKGVNVAFEAIK